MLRPTTLLIVMILAGGPTASLACELWCTSPAAEAHHHAVGCHHAPHTSPQGQQIASTVGCHAAAAVTPFVTQARQTESASTADTALPLFEPTAIGVDASETTTDRYIVNVRPPRPASSRTVLRI